MALGLVQGQGVSRMQHGLPSRRCQNEVLAVIGSFGDGIRDTDL